MTDIVFKNKHFRYFPCLRYPSDAKLQKANRPSSLNFADAWEYLSEEHKLYGFKSKAAVLPNGIRIHFPSHSRGSFADIDIFKDSLGLHRYDAEKLGDVQHSEDLGDVEENFPCKWSILMERNIKTQSRISMQFSQKRKSRECFGQATTPQRKNLV